MSLRLRLSTIELAFNWRWAPIVLLAIVLLGHSVMPWRFPRWQPEIQWLTSAAIILAGEAALLLHEISHALAAGRSARIVFHGFVAETVMVDLHAERDDVWIALAGPAMNLALAALAAIGRLGLANEGPLDTFLVLTLASNVAMATLSLVPIGGSDGARAWRALRPR